MWNLSGRPSPHINWYNGKVLVDASGSDSDIPNVRQNELYLTLTRDTKRITCEATNTILSAPISSYVDVELYRKHNEIKTFSFLISSQI